MIRLRDISIRNKLILMLVFTSVLVLGVFFIVFIISDIRDYKQRKVEDMVSLARVVGANTISTLRFRDNDAAKTILEELHKVSPQIINARIVDKNGKLFAHYGKTPSDSFDISALDRKKYIFLDEHLLVSNDIIENNELLGKVFLEVELSELSKIKRSKYQLAIILLIAAVAFTFLIAVIIQTYISRRLLYLVDTMKESGKTGDYSKSIADDGKDEISELIKVFNNLMQQVNENQKRKDEFISIASHELKTPLTSIKGYLELLNEIEDKRQNRDVVQRSLVNVNKLEKLIRDLLDVSKIQSGQLELNIREFYIDDLLDETVAAFQIVSKTHEIVMVGDLDNTKVTADRQRIEQVLTNLLSNAIKYSPGESKVIVHSKKTDKELIVKVKDFGIGVPEIERGNIFERFYRIKDTTQSIAGFGLGLYICRDIIKRHDGRIWVEAEEKGLAFYFTLPLATTLVPEPVED